MPNPSLRARQVSARPGLPSLNFLLILLIFCGTGAALWHQLVGGRFFIFVFVVSGWVASLCLHEFGHAITAYLGGDRSVASTGYLDLDPMRYTDPLLSLLLPVIYIVIGGFGLPGGAVFINFGRLRSKAWAAAVAAAGPVMNILFLLGLAALNAGIPEEAGSLEAGLAALALFQATAIVLNLLPIPGLDGFGVLRPFLRRDVAIRAESVGAGVFLILFLLLWLTPAGRALLRVGLDITSDLGFSVAAVILGFSSLKLF